jgi:hypothetical protein
MAIALAIACGIVAAEMIAESGHRAGYLRRRLDQLQTRIGQMQSRLAVANGQLAEMQREAGARDDFNRILAASDGRLIRLEPRERRGDLGGAIAISRRLSAAALEVAGLPTLAAGERYQLWWIPREGTPIAAEQFATYNGRATDVAIKLSPPRPGMASVIITLEGPIVGNKPSGVALWKGQLREPPAR